MTNIIEEFIGSWDLFANTYLSGWLIAVALALLGCIVVARNQAFLGAAVAQSSAGGVAIAIWLSTVFNIQSLAADEGDQAHPGHTVAAIIAAVFAAIAGLSRGRGGDAATTWLFLMGSCVPMLLLAHQPHGLEEVNRLFASTLIGATDFDVGLFAAMAMIILAGLAIYRRRVCLVVLDPIFASALGISVRGWSAGLAVALGVALGLSIASAGTLFSFGCLVLPALIVRSRCRTLYGMFIAAPIIAFVCCVFAFIWANAHDLPPGQMAVALLGLVYVSSEIQLALVRGFTRLLKPKTFAA
jgi:ABC-type Mn2+/Zn2+ transport system permease subunit